MTKPIKRPFGIIFILVLIFSILLVGEKFIRYYDSHIRRICPMYFNLAFYPYYKLSSIPNLIYEINPNIIMPDDADYGEAIATNSLGFRDKEYSFNKAGNVFRVIGLGDSICYGSGVKFDNRFLKLLEKRLNVEYGNAGKRFEVINCGISAYNMTQYYLNLKEKALKYKPDLVICSLWIDDFQRPYLPSFYASGRYLASIHMYFINHSYLWKFLFHKFFISPIVKPYSENGDCYRKNIESLENMVALLKSLDIELLFILQSTLAADCAANSAYSEVKQIISQKDVRWIEIHPYYIEYLGNGRKLEELAVLPGDAHPNAEGNRIIAEVLFNYLSDSGLAKK